MITFKKIINYYNWGGRFLADPFHIECKRLNDLELAKQPKRYDIINLLLNSFQRETNYLEIGVRNPAINFDKIKANKKFSVDPGLEYKENPVDFKVTSDVFFEQLSNGEILHRDILFDVIFIDGLHKADQVDKDIKNALDFIREDGFIVLHDCNPPMEWHARETHKYEISPAMNDWNGTTWKAYIKWRSNPKLYSCTIDTDWGVGIISKTVNLGNHNTLENEYFEFSVFDNQRIECLNLISFDQLKQLLY